MIKKILIALGAVIILIVLFFIMTLWNTGQFKTIKSHCDCQCKQVIDAVGTEDITIDRATGIAFISTDDRRARQRGETKQGAIYSYSLASGSPVLENLTAGFKKEFHPHGISFYKTSNGKILLFVINHPGEEQYIEIFEYRDEKLHHIESISGKLMTSPNDVVAVGERQFYVTNDHGATTPFMKALEDYLSMPWAYILFYDGNSFRKVADDISYANGINLSNDGNILYATATTGRLLRIFSRDKKTGSLTKIKDINLNTGVDNIDIDSDGNISIACHPKMLDFISHAKDPVNLSPSQVIKISPVGKGDFKIEEVYLNKGDEISGSSVAVLYEGMMLIGCVFDNKFLVCTLKK